MNKLQEFARKWITPSGTSDEVIEECAQDLYEAVMATTDMGRSQHVKRPTTDSQESEFAEEAAEQWKPEEGEEYFTVRKGVVLKPERKFVWYVEEDTWTEDSYEKEGAVFYDCWSEAQNEADRLNAEREAAETESSDLWKYGNMPRLDPEAHRVLEESFMDIVSESEIQPAPVPMSDFMARWKAMIHGNTMVHYVANRVEMPFIPLGTLNEFMESFQPPSGRFVPEEEIEKLREAADGFGYGVLKTAALNFLQAIEREEDSDATA